MDISALSRKEIGDLGERTVIHYLQKEGFRLEGRNISRKTGEIDVYMRRKDVLHFVEVKTILCEEFPKDYRGDTYDPSVNLHEVKIRKVARTAEWLAAERDWEGEWQVDAALVWLRKRDRASQVLYLPQIL